MKYKLSLFMTFLLTYSLVYASGDLTLKTDALQLELDETGKVTALKDIAMNRNYITTLQPSYLLECQTYGKPKNASMMHPTSMKIISQTNRLTKVELSFEKGIRLTVAITPKDGYFHMKLTDAQPVGDISHISWGPYKTTMQGPTAEWLGFNRSDEFTLGLLSLELNTDAKPNIRPWAAQFEYYGSNFHLWSFDHTRAREYQKHRHSVPVPGLTVIGSTVALLGCPAGKHNELEILERIELAEDLPHPTYKGKWAKRSLEVQKPCIWIDIDQSNIDECIKIGKHMAAGTLCRFHGFFRNWGHFDIDPNIYPGGIEALKANSKKAQKNGINLTTYTLTSFLRPVNQYEPYLAPIPDSRLEAWTPTTALVQDIVADDTEITVKTSDELIEVFSHPYKVIRVENELIEFKQFAEMGQDLLLKDCERGAFYTTASPHSKTTKVSCLFVSGYHNFYPGTMDMNNEIAAKIGSLTKKADIGKVLLDGFESCYETGHGDYAQNIFLKTIYDMCSDRDMLYATSPSQANYTWHMISYHSWGEYELHKGFRGTMLDYRLSRQIQMKRNLIPNKLGQYYPNQATLEDIEWLMARVVGWESGVDLHLNIADFKRNLDYESIGEAVRLWEKARLGNAFSEQQKMRLRQTDTLYKLSQDPSGKWKLDFVRFWQHPGLRIHPPSAFKIEPSMNKSLSKCSIDWAWTHDPGIYAEAGLSDDLIHQVNSKQTNWEVTYPKGPNPDWSGTQLQLKFVFRLPENAPSAVCNIKVSVNDHALEVPVTLEPGQYISTPHSIPMAFVYNSKHQVIKEVIIPQHNPYWYAPTVNKGIPVTISISCDSVDPEENPEVRANLLFYHELVPPQFK